MTEISLPRGVQWGRDLTDGKASGVFTSVKTLGAIEFRRRWHLDGLRALSLDPKVKRIETWRGDHSLCEAAETLILVTLDDGRIVVGFGRDPAPPFLIGGEAFRLFTRTDVEAEPRATTVRQIWSARGVQVDAADRIRILRATAEAKADGLALEAMIKLVRWPLVEPVHAILAMVVDAELVIDIDRRLMPETVVRRAEFWPQCPDKKGSDHARPVFAVSAAPADAKLLTNCRTPKKRSVPKRIKRRDPAQIEMLMALPGGKMPAESAKGIKGQAELVRDETILIQSIRKRG
jgi:hypothetical protein